MTAVHLSSSQAKPSSGNRLGLALIVVVLLHAALLCISFDLHKPGQLSKTLEITLATFKSAEAPDKADYIAQDNQQGSGALEHKAVPTTTEIAPFQDTEVRHVTPPAASVPPPQPQQAAKAAVATQQPQQQKVTVKQEQKKSEQPAEPLRFDRDQLSAQIASLEADVALEKQLYAKRPKIHRINAASTMRDRGAWYKDDWRRKVERVGNQNYPDEARRQQIYGSLRLLVTIRRDGSLQEVQILESSGQTVLDQAAMRIVRLAAPYAPFSGDLAEFDQLEIVRTWRFERGDRLLSQ